MPRDSQGAYNLPPSYLAVTGQDIVITQHNPVFEDVAAALTGSLPRNGSAPMLAELPMGGFKLTSVGAGTASTDAATKGQVDASAPPIGSVIDYAGVAAPSGWALCYGQAVSRSSYAALFAVIGTTYGGGDGSTTFNLPDCRGRVVAGKDNMGGTSANRLTGATGGVNGSTLGGAGGGETQTLTTAQMPSHAHGGETGFGTGAPIALNNLVQNLAGNNSFPTGGFAGFANLSVPFNTHKHPITAEGGNEAHNNVQPTMVLNKIIRAL